ncbi:MAG TPA: hypothetical protein VE504_04500 [Nitrososphaeraceae archaeon]|jgi:hypothetical protein|nr:hypothetical protein [Nitrososphaeraceae archaeon]
MSDMESNGNDVASHGRGNVETYALLIEQYLKNETVSHSESDIAKAVLKVALDTRDDIPSSPNDLDKLTEIKKSLRMLVIQGKIFQTLVQDPETKEETVYYSIRRPTVGP